MIMQNIEIFTSAPKAHFYDHLFLNLDLSEMPEYDSKTSRRGYSNHAKLCAFIVMKCECFSYITDLLDFLQNNQIIAHYCGFDITRPLPSYWTLDRFLNQIDHDILDRVLQTQVEKLTALGMIDPSFIAIDSTPIMADKGYDSKAVYNLIQDVYHGDCVIPLNKRNTKNPKKLASGHPICEAGLAMHKDGKFSDSGRTRQKYCCPFKCSKTGVCPCNHKNWNNGKKYRGCTKYVTLPDDYRLSIDRECITFKKIYAMRTEIERYNSRFKNTGQERLWVHSIDAARNLNSIAHIALLSVAIAATVTKSECSYRCLKSVKRTA